MSDALADEFDPVSVDQWRAAAQEQAGDDTPLTTELEDGLSVAWLYTRADALASDPGGAPGQAPYTRGARIGTPWAIRQENGAPARAQANAEILEDLEGGATEIALRLDPEGAAGIPVSSVEELDEVLDGVYLDLAPVALSAGRHAVTAARLLVELWQRRELEAEQVSGSLRLDPIPTLAHTGEATEADYSDAIAEAIVAARELGADVPRVQLLAVDTGTYVEGGAGATLELALALATALAYLRAAEAAGVNPASLARRLEFTLLAGPDQFLEIAKFRAVRRLWGAVLEHCGVEPEERSSRTYARTSRRMVSSLDPWVNMLRATTAAFAAGVGGADGVTVLPFDEATGETLGAPGPLGRRMARNTQLVLLEESSLYRVADPAGGSWYVEALTDEVARRAWDEFQALERGGGIVPALCSGALPERLAADTERRHDELARRQRILTGVNTFPLLGDDGLERDATAASAEPTSSAAVPAVRDAAAFEHLRARATALADRDSEPSVFLACMGPLAAHVAIAQWAKSFFESGGVKTIASGPQQDEAAQAALLTEHGLSVAVLCPGRGVQADAQASLAASLREAGAQTVYLAGAGADAAQAVGADVAVADGVDMVAVLSDLLDRLSDGREEAA